MNSKILTQIDEKNPIEINSIQPEEWIGKGKYSNSVHLISAKVGEKAVQLVEKTPNEQFSFISKIPHILRTHQICKEIGIPTFPTLRTDGTNLYSTPYFQPGEHELLTANNYAKRIMYLQLENNLTIEQSVIDEFEKTLHNNTQEQGIILSHFDAFGFLTSVKDKKITKILIPDFDTIGYYQKNSPTLHLYPGKHRDIINTNLRFFRQSMDEMKKNFGLKILS